MLRRASSAVIASAPTAGAARSTPSPQGPVCRMSRAYIGISAVAPPSSTANMSSEIVPRIAWSLRTKAIPAKRSPSRGCGRSPSGASSRIAPFRMLPISQKPPSSHRAAPAQRLGEAAERRPGDHRDLEHAGGERRRPLELPLGRDPGSSAAVAGDSKAVAIPSTATAT